MQKQKLDISDVEKHPPVERDARKNAEGAKDMDPNLDRSLGDADRTGRHSDDRVNPAPDEGSRASEDHEAD